jgi:hypothetical protein
MSGLGIVSPNFIKVSCKLITIQLHRDIKLTNIFIGESYMLSCEAKATIYVIVIDGKGDCKGKHIVHSEYLKYLTYCAVGDFGLATSSLAAVDPSDVSPILVTPDADMTLGTALCVFYVAR